MKVSINGESTDTQGAKTIAELIDRFEFPPQTVLIEHNGIALHRHEWSQRAITEGDRVEFLRVVAGG
jgi:thiamine biosynthesis protein ThiS